MFAKKKLVAAAALLALAGAAQAEVKLYGMVDMSVGSFENAHAKGASDRVTAIESGKMMTSYFGIAGSEDLGGGLKAEFVLESFIGADAGKTLGNNAGGFWGRGSFVALSGGFGKVAVGQYDNALFISGLSYNPFGSSMTFSPTMRHYYGLAGNYGAALGIDTGWVNSVTYETPTVGGFMASAQYSPKESKNVDGSSNSYTLAASYNAGPLSAMLTYANIGYTDAAYAAYVADQKVWALGASYDFGVAKAFLQYTDIKTDASLSISGTPPVASVTDEDGAKAKIYQVGVSVPLSDKASVMASYGRLKDKEDNSSDKVLSIGYNYVLSKRTDVYGVFTNNSQSGTGNTKSGQTFAVGLRHNF